VTKLSLLLKVLEGENAETLGKTYKLFHDRALPDLGDNIKCGNSLIGPDFYEDKQLSLLDEEERYRINAFDWDAEFPEIFKPSPSEKGKGEGGGFDVVIGNPPYIRIQAMKEWAPIEVEYYKKRYTAASKGNYDIYVVFVERALQLLHARGRMGFILPHKFFQAKYGQALRKLISEARYLSEVVHFGDRQVFPKASTYTCLLFLDKAGVKRFHYVKAHDLTAWRNNGEAIEGEIPADKATKKEWNFVVGPGASLFERLSEMPVKLNDVAQKIFQGLITGADHVFILNNVANGFYTSVATGDTLPIESSLMHSLCKGSINLRRYCVSEITKSILFPYKLINGKAYLLSPQELQEQFPNAWAYLKVNRHVLEARERGKWKHDRWYAFSRSQNLSEMEQTKILTPSIADHTAFVLDRTQHYYFVGSGGGGGGGYGITLANDSPGHLTYPYVLGLLNSQLLDWYLKRVSSPFRGGYYSCNRQYIERLPIRTIDFNKPVDKARHDRMVELVETMLDLHKQLAAAKTSHEKTAIQRQIVATDRQIDQLVYELYGLTDEEIRIVEGVKK